MTEIVLAINEQDCTSDDGNTAGEFEAIAVTLLRAAERPCGIRKRASWSALGTMARPWRGSIYILAVPTVTRTP
jgi:hypothetical protein